MSLPFGGLLYISLHGISAKSDFCLIHKSSNTDQLILVYCDTEAQLKKAMTSSFPRRIPRLNVVEELASMFPFSRLLVFFLNHFVLVLWSHPILSESEQSSVDGLPAPLCVRLHCTWPWCLTRTGHRLRVVCSISHSYRQAAVSTSCLRCTAAWSRGTYSPKKLQV